MIDSYIKLISLKVLCIIIFLFVYYILMKNLLNNVNISVPFYVIIWFLQLIIPVIPIFILYNYIYGL